MLDQALAHEGIAVLADLRLHEQFAEVLQPNAALVQVVLVVAAPISAPTDHYLFEVDGQPPVAVIERELDLGHALCGAPVAAGEDDVFRLAGAE